MSADFGLGRKTAILCPYGAVTGTAGNKKRGNTEFFLQEKTSDLI
jgi:hypothetical protein